MKSYPPSWAYDLPMDLASLLRRYRATSGLTQEELAEKAEVSTRTVSDVERGLRTRIYKDTASRLAEALKLEGSERATFEQAARGRSVAIRVMPVVPVPATRLIGRGREVEVVLRTLERTDVRLISLTGPGGIGKTRIALEASAQHPDAFFVQLGDLVEPRLVVPAIARAVGVSATKAATVEAIAEHLADRRSLIVLDTFEHVIDAGSDIGDLLSASPMSTLLVTSRETLRIRGEHEVAIGVLEAESSTALFWERALASKPNLPVTDESQALVTDICHRLGGLPLAIELAAARVRHLALTALREELQRGLHILSGGPRDLPRRQQTMRDTVAWSLALLDVNQQRLLRELAVFAGGWTLDAAEAVCSGPDLLDGVSALVDKSLVYRANDTRYDMLDVIREYEIEFGVEGATRAAHAAYFLRLARDAEPELGRADQQRWLARISEENANIHAAIDNAIAFGDAEIALGVAGAIWRYWLLLGALSEGRHALRRALDAEQGDAPRSRAKALWGYAWLAYHQGDVDVTEQCARELLMLAESAADLVELRNASTVAGIAAQARGLFEQAVDHFRRGAELLGGRRDWLDATSLLNLGTALMHTGDPDAAKMIADARALYSELGDQHFVARSDLYAGYTALFEGEIEGARTLFAASLETFWELDDDWGVAEAVEGSAALAAASGDPERAAWIAGAAEGLRSTISARPFASDSAVLERYLIAVRASLDEDLWRRQWDAGRGAGAEQVVDSILSETIQYPST